MNLVEMRNIHKSFGNVQALKNISLAVKKNEVLGLVGDNGAGKSTLIKILSGIVQQDEGRIFVEGEEERIQCPRDAIDLGIRVVHQDSALINELSVRENFFMGEPITNNFLFLNILDKKKMNNVSLDYLKRLGVQLETPEKKVGNLSGGERQAINIGRQMYFGGKVIIFDEPTASLSLDESERVMRYIGNLKEEGYSAIVISHLIKRIYPPIDRFVVLENGEKIASVEKSNTSIKDISNMIIGG